MTIFWLSASAMVLLALAILAPALLRRGQVRELDRDQQNVAIARERLAELRVEYEAGQLSEEAFRSTREELELMLLTDLEPAARQAVAVAEGRGRWMLPVLALAVPLMAVSLYLALGNPDLIEPPETPVAAGGHDGTSGKMPSVDAMLEALVQRLQQEPDNARGWYLLARSYMSLGRYEEAVKAFERLHALVGDQPGVLTGLADALAMTQGARLSGRPFELLQKALEIQPDDPTALWLTGQAYMEQGKPREALEHWQRLDALLADQPESQAELRQLMARAEQQLRDAGEALPEPVVKTTTSRQPAAGAVSLKVRIELDPALAGKIDPEAPLFIYAKALEGPPMPLAAVRKQVKDLPLEVVLDDRMAMMPAMRLSAFKEVRVGARVSLSGDPVAHSGDLFGELAPVAVDSKTPIAIRIDQRVP
ncbi:c-type cytochrome biogenesis protein CcmI [Thiohalobacter sp. IOR34]|uniref:c-type cytochrome biogenesis protein CcmI n=1 Tax=Thiohalobacter sp. IOR34 TaxID=3057176 RepID=UPI0025AEDC25|nr:c-type cytochrome biogenesis protein CcmI [Thiohalobacter sp. IOR34]WJW76495.1 c-type cytochrome biogenesis protein CcmI [Thiohalobacter sp. IOR34]